MIESDQNATVSQLAAALRYAALGWQVIPLHHPVNGGCSCGRPDCGRAAGKHPRFSDWVQRATTDEAAIRGWWRQYPQANVGLVTGSRSAFFVLDVDPEHGGSSSLAALEQQHGAIPATVEALTGSGGRHILLRYPGHHVPNSCSRLGPGLDIRGDGGQIVAAPSLHRTGGSYSWVHEHEPGTVIADAPAWLLDLIREPVRMSAPAQRQQPADGAARRASAYLARIPGAVDGEKGHPTTFKAAFAVVRGFRLSEDEAFSLLWSEYNPRCQPPWDEKALHHKIQSAMRDSTVPFGYLLDAERPDTRLCSAQPSPTRPGHSGDIDHLPTVEVTAQPVADWQSRRLNLSPEAIRSDPPPRVYLLHDAGTGEGVMVKGKVGLFAAVGGTGKSWAFTQLAVAVASGRTWFGAGGWAPLRAGRVLMILAEEDEGEVMRRIHYAAKEAGIISEPDLAEMCKNLDSFGLAGMPVSLTSSSDDDSKLPVTSFGYQIRQRIYDAARDEQPYDLVIIDPLSRFAGGDVEKDNAAATRWVQTAEMFAAEDCGDPSVLAAHHLRKPSKDDDHESASLIRGASALTDGVRWAAILEQQKRHADSADLLILRVVKCNGVPPREPLILCRPCEGNEGVLRVATGGEIASHPALADKAELNDESLAEFTDAVLSAVDHSVDPMSRNDIGRVIGKRKSSVLRAIGKLVRDGVLVSSGTGKTSIITRVQSVPAVPAPVPGTMFEHKQSCLKPTSDVITGNFTGSRGSASVPGTGTASVPEPVPMGPLLKKKGVPKPGLEPGFVTGKPGRSVPGTARHRDWTDPDSDHEDSP